MKNIPIFILAIISTSGFGIIALLYPKKVKKYLMNKYQEDPLAKFYPAYWWLKSPLYLPITMFLGIVSFILSLLLLYLLLT